MEELKNNSNGVEVLNTKEETDKKVEQWIKENIIQTTGTGAKTIPVAGKQTQEMTKKEKAIEYLQNATNRMKETLMWNEKEDWTDREHYYIYDILPKEVIRIQEIIDIVKELPAQEKAIWEIEQKVRNNQLKDIKVDFANKGLLKIINTSTGAILFEEKPEVINRIIEGMLKMKTAQATVEEIKETTEE